VTGLLTDLPTFDAAGVLRVVVEAPKGCTVKIAYEPDLRTFCVSRGFPMGIAYPYDWGFIPGTLAEDGDPVDALVLHAPRPTRAWCCRAVCSAWWKYARTRKKASGNPTIA